MEAGEIGSEIGREMRTQEVLSMIGCTGREIRIRRKLCEEEEEEETQAI